MTPPLPDAALLDEIERRPMEPGKAPEVSRDEIKQLIAAARAGLRVPALEERRDTLFEAIKHGDDVHRAWLKEAIEHHFASQPVPPPTGKGRSAALEDEVARLTNAKTIVNMQACDDGLWFRAETATEAYLQEQLRALHAAIEGKTPEQCALAALTPKDPAHG